jgi:hypothetical protein
LDERREGSTARNTLFHREKQKQRQRQRQRERDRERDRQRERERRAYIIGGDVVAHGNVVEGGLECFFVVGQLPHTPDHLLSVAEWELQRTIKQASVSEGGKET